MARRQTQDPAAALRALLRAAGAAADWMCEASEGTDQHERGVDLREAQNAYRAAQQATPRAA